MPNNVKTTAQLQLISHTSRVMLKIFQDRFQQYINREILDVQARFRKGRGTRDQIANIWWIILLILLMGFSRQEYWSGLPFPSPVDHILSELSTWPVCLGWPYMAWLSFSELDKAVVHVIRLASFLWLWFQSVCPLGKQWKQWLTLFWGAPKSLHMVTAAMKLKDTYSSEGKLWPT